ncbi:protein phosphatase 2C domain-containing protein [Gordonia sp. NB41Y]|uniref:PP2C family protein-serine/threonine phosphatase n=1 Tax=Gordonia sp. NB41Y TaxID=875808 RepID=UPI0006B220AD|nr:protein phosphatase 2C domain-containing protein [Gordonia sp. NB41Y]KOY49901.1 protein phosphatase [Gordonia sp. NB41Y]WLP91044.1 protein phosphatase 2C domain-containing protein [Gordonia sp. NB41Y]
MDSVSIVRDESTSGTHFVGNLRLEWAVRCSVGMVRETNEDAALALPGTYLLADGMGGHDSGEVASEAALLTLAGVESSGELIETQKSLIDLLDQAQTRISEIETATERRAGTTATGAVLVTVEEEPHWLILNIGDSRTYRFQHGTLQQLTRDHSQVQDFIDAGFLTPEDARTDPRRNVITRALGAGMIDPVADYFSTVALPGDVLLMCSDGLTGELPDDEIARILGEGEGAVQTADDLVEAALALGAHDNVTVIVVDVHESVSTIRMPAVDDVETVTVDDVETVTADDVVSAEAPVPTGESAEPAEPAAAAAAPELGAEEAGDPAGDR